MGKIQFIHYIVVTKEKWGTLSKTKFCNRSPTFALQMKVKSNCEQCWKSEMRNTWEHKTHFFLLPEICNQLSKKRKYAKHNFSKITITSPKRVFARKNKNKTWFYHIANSKLRLMILEHKSTKVILQMRFQTWMNL